MTNYTPSIEEIRDWAITGGPWQGRYRDNVEEEVDRGLKALQADAWRKGNNTHEGWPNPYEETE